MYVLHVKMTCVLCRYTHVGLVQHHLHQAYQTISQPGCLISGSTLRHVYSRHADSFGQIDNYSCTFQSPDSYGSQIRLAKQTPPLLQEVLHVVSIHGFHMGILRANLPSKHLLSPSPAISAQLTELRSHIFRQNKAELSKSCNISKIYIPSKH
jgi:hypothetical protein